MPGYDRLGRNQRHVLSALRDGATLTRAEAGWLLDGRLTSGEACAALYARDYIAWDERGERFVLTQKGRGA